MGKPGAQKQMDYLEAKKKMKKEQIFGEKSIKGCVRYIFASLFYSLNEDICQTTKNVSYFTSNTLFVFEIKLTFQIFKCCDVMKCPSMKHETHCSK